MKTKYLFLFSVILILFSNCQKKIDLNLPNYEQKIVINGILSADSTIKISITKSINSNNTSLRVPRITDAQVNLYKNGVFEEKLIFDGKDYYVSSTKVTANQEYSVKIIADGKSFNKNIKVPKKTHFLKIKYLDYNNTDNSYMLNIQIADQTGENFYIIAPSALVPNIIYNDTGGVDSIQMIKNVVSFSSQLADDPYLEHTVNLYSYVDYGIMFNDALFDGNIFDNNFYIENNNFYIDTTIVHTDSLTVYFQLFTISKDLYNFFISYEKYNNSSDMPLSEPVNIYSNIDGGAGILCSMSCTIDSIKIPYIVNF